MDPSDQPPQPSQPPPPWGAPPPDAPAGTPYGAPAGAPYGAPPEWNVPPAAPKRGGIPRVLIGAGVLVLIVIVGIVAAVLLMRNPDAGKVVFTTDQPTAGGATTCQVGTRVTTVKVGVAVYAIYFFDHRLATTDTVSLQILKDGTALGSTTLPSNQTSGIDCVEAFENIGTSLSQPGAYEIKLTVNGSTVSDGTLTITP